MKNLTNRELAPRTKQIVEYVFAHPDYSHQRIANEFKIHKSRISQVLHNERVLAYFPILARRQYTALIPKAMMAQTELIGLKSNPMVRDKASARALEAANILNQTPQIQINVLGQLTNEELMRKINQSQELPAPSIDSELAE